MRFKTKRHDLPTILKAATAYFALVFGAGFILGPIRILFIVPRFGERLAELMEAPVMLTVIFVAARWVVRKVHTEHRLAIGVFALCLMIAFEVTLVLWLRGLTLDEYFRELKVMGPRKQRIVNGVVAGEIPSISKQDRERIRAALHRLRIGDIREEDQDGYIATQKGRIAYLAGVNPRQAKRFQLELAQLLEKFAR